MHKIHSSYKYTAGHAPRERVSWNRRCAGGQAWRIGHAPRERVSWNHRQGADSWLLSGHAPRERVSWNPRLAKSAEVGRVTLHVSVWVEILNEDVLETHFNVTLHVSVWVEIADVTATYDGVTSRSTWACELKCIVGATVAASFRHAPRERVSWNTNSYCGQATAICHAPRERVSWNC